MKKLLITTLAVAAIGFGIYFGMPLRTTHLDMSVTKYNSLAELESKAQLIVIGTPEKDFSEYTPNIKYTDQGRYEDFYTKTNLKIIKVIKGSSDLKIIPVIQGAALVSSPFKFQKDMITLGDYSVMQKGDKYLLFLTKTQTGDYGLLGVFQGKFNTDNLDSNEKILANKDKSYRQLREAALSKYIQ